MKFLWADCSAMFSIMMGDFYSMITIVRHNEIFPVGLIPSMILGVLVCSHLTESDLCMQM